jgi:Alcohol dehydrogenase GroES-associated
MSATEVRTASNEGGDSKMKALNYQGPFKVKVEEVPKPTIEHPDDVIVKITTAGMMLALPLQCWTSWLIQMMVLSDMWFRSSHGKE